MSAVEQSSSVAWKIKNTTYNTFVFSVVHIYYKSIKRRCKWNLLMRSCSILNRT